MNGRFRWCQPCALAGREFKASGIVEGDPMCDACRKAVTVATFPIDPRKQRAFKMDKLIAEEVPVASVPEGELIVKPRGRSGELWERFKALKPGVALKVVCRDRSHMGCTHRALTLRATAAEMVVGSRRVGTTYYCWKVQP